MFALAIYGTINILLVQKLSDKLLKEFTELALTIQVGKLFQLSIALQGKELK